MPDATPVTPPIDPTAGQTSTDQTPTVTDVAVAPLADADGNSLNAAMIVEKAGDQYVVTFYDAASNQFFTGSDDASQAFYVPATPGLDAYMARFGTPGNLLTVQQAMASPTAENMADPQPPQQRPGPVQGRYDPTIKVTTNPTTGKTHITGFFPLIDFELPPPQGTGGFFGPIRIQGGLSVQAPILPAPGMPTPSYGVRVEIPFGRVPKRTRPQPAPVTQPPAPLPPTTPTPPPSDDSSSPPAD